MTNEFLVWAVVAYLLLNILFFFWFIYIRLPMDDLVRGVAHEYCAICDAKCERDDSLTESKESEESP